MRELSKLEELIQLITKDPNVIRFKELEKKIDEDNELMNSYKKLIDLQKVMVQQQAKGSNRIEQSEKQYNDQLNIVLNHILMGEYLDVLEVVNNDLQMIKDIILNEISADFE